MNETPDIPDRVQKQLQEIAFRDLNPAFLLLDHDGNLRSWGGDVEAFGLMGLTEGAYIGEVAFYLDGMFPLPDAMDIPAMMTDSGKYADIHMIPTPEGASVLLIDVSDSTQQRQMIQQRGNELSLLSRQLEIRNRFIKQTFGRYLSDEIVEQILDTPDGLNLTGETRTVTILMNDLRGFTSMCERLEPGQVVTMLNNFLGAMTEVILKHQGTIDEFIGDAILVIFGAPIQRDDDAARAVACATDMMLAMEEINAFNVSHGLPEVEMGIGLNTGDVIVGNIGSERRLKYGVVGSNVNLTARVESYTVGGQILVSERTRNDAGEHIKINGSMEVSPKGVKEPITIYDVGGIGGEFDTFLPEVEEVVQALQSPVPLEYQILEGKHASGEMAAGKFSALSNRGGLFADDVDLELKSNLKIHIFDDEGERIPGDLYAKVVPGPAEQTGAYVRFTAIPPVLDQYLQNVISKSY